MSFGNGLIAALGAIGGAGEAAAYLGKTWNEADLKEELAKANDARMQNLARLQGQVQQDVHRGNIGADMEALPERLRLEAEAKIDVAKRSPRTLAEGATEIVDGQPGFTAPKTAAPISKEQGQYYEAAADRLNAEAQAIRDGLKYKGPADAKPQLPSVKPEKDEGGNTYMIDQNSGAMGFIIPGKAGEKGASHWIGPKDPDKPAKSPEMAWSYNGKVLPNGLSDLYPDMKKRIGGSATERGSAPTASDDSGWDPETGAVFANGRQIGTVDKNSKTARADAQGLWRKSQSSGEPGALGGTLPRTSDLTADEPEQAPHTRGLIGTNTDQIIPPPSPASPRNPAYLKWKAQYGETWDALSPRTQQMLARR